MSYIREILRPDEKLLATGNIHWIIYWPAIALMALAVISLSVLGLASIVGRIIFVLLALAAIFFAIKEWLQQWITEIAVTDRRVIVKTGLIRRHTAEMNMDKVESVTVYQRISHASGHKIAAHFCKILRRFLGRRAAGILVQISGPRPAYIRPGRGPLRAER